MNKYYLIYEYHDTWVRDFDTKEELDKFLKILKNNYKYDRDFKYNVIYGKELNDYKVGDNE